MCIQKVRNIMKIRNIKIKGLYDIYDYDLDFFEDVTFLHGINGSGKTTILEIISNIISGNLSYLLKYLFEEIVLSYTNKNGYEETIMMNIIKDEKVINFYKLVQAQKIMELYNSFKEQKVKIEKPLQDFIKIINDFYDTGYYGKKFYFQKMVLD